MGAARAEVRDVSMCRDDSGYGMSLAGIWLDLDLLGHNRHLDLNSTRKASPGCAPCSSCSVLRAWFVGVRVRLTVDGWARAWVRLRAEGGDRSDQATQDWPSEDSTTEKGREDGWKEKVGYWRDTSLFSLNPVDLGAQAGAGLFLASTVLWYVSAPQSGEL